MRQVTKEKLALVVGTLLMVALGFGAVVLGWPAARGAYEARRLAAVMATGADGRQFTVMDVLEQVAGEKVQQAIQQQKQAAEATKAAEPQGGK